MNITPIAPGPLASPEPNITQVLVNQRGNVVIRQEGEACMRRIEVHPDHLPNVISALIALLPVAAALRAVVDLYPTEVTP